MASSVDAKLLRQTKFPAEFNKRVDMTKVNIEVMKKSVLKQILSGNQGANRVDTDGLQERYRKS